ncbi:MAG: class I SAM-dependent methyltransferase [Lachnospiraceae bacterium]|nr:class I SAM-dependent methyltransferase [Lachnospiraceae bacterium]
MEQKEKELPLEEIIGKIKLDYRHYPGQDFYCDGTVEDELLDIVKKYGTVEYPGIIEERASWPVLYHLSDIRENIVEWIPMDENAKVLEVGSGCGAITGVLSRKAASVTCVDLSKKRSYINAYRHPECDNVTINVGNFTDIEPDLDQDFDYIFLIGVLEYGQSYIPTKEPFVDFLKIMKSHLAPGGRIVIAIENKYGLKYWAGAKEDHLGSFFDGMEDYANGGGVRTFTRKGLEKIFRKSGFEDFHFYYPYPDYKFMSTIYSDKRLPGKGELINNLRNFDRDRMQLFDEKEAFDGIIAEGEFSLFSNSYLAVIGEDFETAYVRYSNDRAPEYVIRTEILQQEDKKIVKKQALSKDAEEHIANIAIAYKSLCDRYKGGKLEINTCHYDETKGKQIELDFVEGTTLSELMDRCLDADDEEGFQKLFDEYLERVSYHDDMPVADFDLVFSNILVDGDKWTLIDYEWTFGKAMETRELAFRAVYCYLLEDEKRNKLNLDLIMEKLGITLEEAEYFRKEERDFQKFVTGKHLSLAEIRERIGNNVYRPQDFLDRMKTLEGKQRVQIYLDKGNGFREEESFFLPDAFVSEQEIECSIKVDGNTAAVRIDPAFTACLIKVRELVLNGEPVLFDKKNITCNGKLLPAKGTEYPAMIFATEDPGIYVNLPLETRKAENNLQISMEYTRITLQMAEELAASVKRIF